MRVFGAMGSWLDKVGAKIAALDKRLVLVGLVLLVIPLFRPDLLSHVDDKTFVNLYKYWGLISGVCALTLFVVLGRKGAFAYFAVLLVGSVLVATFMFDGKVSRWFVYWLPSAIMALLVASTCRCFYRELVVSVLVVTTVLEVMNFASVIIFPDGMWATDRVAQNGNYFFDHRNNAYKLLFPMLLCSSLLDGLNGKKVGIRTILLLALSYAQLILAPSATSMVALTLLVVFFVLVQWRRARSIFNSLTFLSVSVVSFVLVVVMRLQDVFGFFIVDVLHKNMTFTGRTYIWDATFEMFHGIRHALFGYGVSGYKQLVIDGHPYSHAHNEFLDVWLNGGFVAVVALLGMLILVSLALYKSRKSREAAVLAVAVGAYYVIGLTEPIVSTSFIFVASVAFYRYRRKDREMISDTPFNSSSHAPICADGEVDYNGSVRLLAK